MNRIIDISVVICTHNPRSAYMERVLRALNDQTLSKSSWELLVIDNASDHDLNKQYANMWPKNTRLVRESRLGLTAARMRGIVESKGELVVFVDDDNVLSTDYLEKAAEKAIEWPRLGVWGGQRLPEWETDPPEWAKPYVGILSISEFKKECWHNFSTDPAALPTGAGMCVRREVVNRYREKLIREPWRMQFDRTGQSLVSCGDFDIVFTSQSINLGVGLFPDLLLTHLIPAERVTETYLLRLREAVSLSMELLNIVEGRSSSHVRRDKFALLRKLYSYISLNKYEYRFNKAHRKGIYTARRVYDELSKNNRLIGEMVGV